MIRFWALGALISWMTALAITVSVLLSNREIDHNSSTVYFQIIPFGLMAAFWALVLCYSKRVTLWVLPAMKDVDHKFHIEPDDMIRMGSFLIGIFYLTGYIVDLLRSAQNILRERWQGQPWSHAVIEHNLVRLAPYVIGILIALWLTSRPGPVVRLFTRLRTAGQPKAAAADDAPKAG